MSYVYVNVDKDYYENMEKRLAREHQQVIHARTRELIVGCTNDKKPKINHKKHLGGFPTCAYHRTINRQQINGKFTINPISKEIRKALKITPTDTAILNIKQKGTIEFKNTKQYKTVWNTKHQRRSRV